jgi:hypothetical protein
MISFWVRGRLLERQQDPQTTRIVIHTGLTQLNSGVACSQLSPEPQPRPSHSFTLGLASPSARPPYQMRNQGSMNVELLPQPQHHD